MFLDLEIAYKKQDGMFSLAIYIQNEELFIKIELFIEFSPCSKYLQLNDGCAFKYSFRSLGGPADLITRARFVEGLKMISETLAPKKNSMVLDTITTSMPFVSNTYS